MMEESKDKNERAKDIQPKCPCSWMDIFPRDKETGEELVNKRNAHYGNMVLLLQMSKRY